jgi:hypothetical protein
MSFVEQLQNFLALYTPLSVRYDDIHGTMDDIHKTVGHLVVRYNPFELNNDTKQIVLFNHIFIEYEQDYFISVNTICTVIIALFMIYKLNQISSMYKNIKKDITDLTLENYKNKLRFIDDIMKIDDRSAKKITLIKNELKL